MVQARGNTNSQTFRRTGRQGTRRIKFVVASMGSGGKSSEIKVETLDRFLRVLRNGMSSRIPLPIRK